MTSLFLLAVLLAATSTAYILESASFGHSGAIAPEGHIRHWLLSGQDYIPELLSDKIILTPPWPGKVQGAAWTEQRNNLPSWLVDFEFRATGPEHANGQLMLWYTKENGAQIGTSNVYNVGKFTGLVLLIDPLGGRGGGIRAFLNDGSKDYRNSEVETLPFGHCDYAYRNLGRPSKLQLHQDAGGLEVLIDGSRCFKADGVVLPADHYFGITANTGETPDSFELFKFVTQSGMSFSREEPMRQQPMGEAPPMQQQQEQQRATIPSPRVGGTPDSPMLNDIHSHVKILMEHAPSGITKLQQSLDSLSAQCATKNEIRGIEAKLDRLQTLMEKMSNEQKDWSGQFDSIQREMKAGTNLFLDKIPESMGTAITKHGPNMIQLIFMLIAAQAVMGLGYVLYKRRAESPKKYL